MQIVAIQRESVFKNLPDKGFKNKLNFNPSKTQDMRQNYYRKSRILSFKKIQEKQLHLTSTERRTQISFLSNQHKPNLQNNNYSFIEQSKLLNPSPLKKIAANLLQIRKNELITIDSKNQKEQKKVVEKSIRSSDLNRCFDHESQSKKIRQFSFRKTFCSSSNRQYKNKSLEIRKVQIRAPTAQIDSYRPSTRIRKVSNIGEESNNNFLAKYEIISQLGKGTYGTVFLAKIIKNDIKQSMKKNCFLNSLRLVSRQSQNLHSYERPTFKPFNNNNVSSTANQLNFQNKLKNQSIQIIQNKQQSFTQQGQNIINLKNLPGQNLFQQRDNQQLNLVVKDNQIADEKQNDIEIQNNKNLKIEKQENLSLNQDKIPNQKVEKFSQKKSLIFQEQHQLVAIKVYQKFKMNKDPAKFKNIRKQITIMQNLSHQGVIKLYESVESITKISLVVQFGGDLSLLDYLRKNFPLPNQKLKFFTKQLLETIIYLHHKNIVHRDIKPQNILVKISQDNKNNERLKLIDFGFSTLTNKSRKLNVICGTPNFMAPQLLNSKQYYGQKADVWSFGVVVFVMAEGRHPFKSTDYKELTRIVNKGKYIFKRKHDKQFQQFIGQIFKANGQQRPTASQIIKHKWLQQP